MEIFTHFYEQEEVARRAIDIALPGELAHKTALFYIHGGGWSAGEREAFHTHLQYFAMKGYACATAGYRLAPTVQLADQMGDIVVGYRLFVNYLRDQYGNEIERIIVLGSSAGAHLASLLAMTKPDEWVIEPDLRRNWQYPAACVSINGPGTLEEWKDMNEEIKVSIEQVIGARYGENEQLFRQASPLARVHPDVPDFLFLIVGKEEYFPHSYIYELEKEIKQHGSYAETVLFPEAEHGFFYGVTSKQQQEALSILEAFLARYE